METLTIAEQPVRAGAVDDVLLGTGSAPPAPARSPQGRLARVALLIAPLVVLGLLAVAGIFALTLFAPTVDAVGSCGGG